MNLRNKEMRNEIAASNRGLSDANAAIESESAQRLRRRRRRAPRGELDPLAPLDERGGKQAPQLLAHHVPRPELLFKTPMKDAFSRRGRVARTFSESNRLCLNGDEPSRRRSRLDEQSLRSDTGTLRTLL